jgi:Peptidase M10 serralysin C terminal
MTTQTAGSTTAFGATSVELGAVASKTYGADCWALGSPLWGSAPASASSSWVPHSPRLDSDLYVDNAAPANAIRAVNGQNDLITTELAVTGPIVYRYDFTYFYSGFYSSVVGDLAAGDGTSSGSLFGAGTGAGTATATTSAADYYTGFVYGNANRYQANTYVDYSANPGEAQANGRYWISQVTQAGSAADVGRVTVTQYYDGETNSLVRPASGSGSQDLGSEVGYLSAVARHEERFGNDYYAADRLLTRPLDPQAATGKSAGDATLDALLNHDASGSVSYWNTHDNGGTITYSFYQPTSGPYAGRETVTPVTEAIKTNVRNILADLETAINLRFVEVADTATDPGVLRYQFSTGSGPGFYAYTYYPGLGTGSDVHLSSAYASEFAKGPGSYGYKSLVHETLHGLGLKHPGNYNAGGGGSQGPYLWGGVDNSTDTIMTYNLAGSYGVTPMDYDLRALQYLYGARVEPANNTYRFISLAQYSIDGRSLVSRGGNLVKQTLWDGGGDQDTLDFSALTGSYRFDLNPGGILTSQLAYNSVAYDDVAGGGRYQTSDYGTVIATGTLIENIINSRGNDTIILNSASNQVLGYSLATVTGNDVIEGASSQDTVVLSGYRLADLTASFDGSDLRLQLAQNGSILFKNYVASGVRVLLDGALYVYGPSPNSVPKASAASDQGWLTVSGGAAAAQVAAQTVTPLAARTVAPNPIPSRVAAIPG